MKFIDLFAGIGGFRYGLKKANEYISKQRRIRTSIQSKRNKSINKSRNGLGKQAYSCVYSNEWDKYASQIYKKHYGECDTRDIRTVEVGEIPDHDLLCAGYPCQAFSIAGKRRGFEDTRGTLFFEICRIAKAKRPKLLLLENVKGLLSHDKGKTFYTTISSLDELGYDCEWQVLNSKNFGVPQNRERVFIIGHFRGESRPKVFPIRYPNEANNVQNKKLPEQISNTPRTNYSKGLSNEAYVLKEITKEQQQGMRVYNPKGISTTLAGQAGGWGAKTGLYKTGMKIRRLTPTECERLQGFPDGWTEGISNTQRYKCLGNAVTTNVITAIGKRLI